MSTYNPQKHSILDAPSGKIGPVIFYSWKGIDCVRSMPQYYHDARTLEQQQNRSKLSTLMAFQSPLKEAIRNGFKYVADHTSEINEATRINFRTAMQTVGPVAQVIYSQLFLSWGDLPLLSNVQRITLNHQLLLHWDLQPSFNPSDQVCLALYNETRHTAHFHPHIATRQDQGAAIPIPKTWQHDCVHCWLWLNGNSSNSRSQYLGTILPPQPQNPTQPQSATQSHPKNPTRSQPQPTTRTQSPIPLQTPDSKGPKCYQTPVSLGSDSHLIPVSHPPASSLESPAPPPKKQQ